MFNWKILLHFNFCEFTAIMFFIIFLNYILLCSVGINYAKQILQYLMNIVTKSGSDISGNKRHNLQPHKPILWSTIILILECCSEMY